MSPSRARQPVSGRHRTVGCAAGTDEPAWTGVGLASGLFYRELTKHFGLAGTRELAGTQLAVVHTHVLTLGTLVLLLLVALVAQLPWLASDKRFQWGVRLWQVGLGVTTAGMVGPP